VLSIPPIPPIISTETKSDEFKKSLDEGAARQGYDKERLESMKRSAQEKYNKG